MKVLKLIWKGIKNVSMGFFVAHFLDYIAIRYFDTKFSDQVVYSFFALIIILHMCYTQYTKTIIQNKTIKVIFYSLMPFSLIIASSNLVYNLKPIIHPSYFALTIWILSVAYYAFYEKEILRVKCEMDNMSNLTGHLWTI